MIISEYYVFFDGNQNWMKCVFIAQAMLVIVGNILVFTVTAKVQLVIMLCYSLL